MDQKLSKIYYSPQGYWKGMAAISKLSKAAGVDKNDVKRWLEKQVLWQIYQSPPKYIPRPSWNISKPNRLHQADLLFLPHDTIRTNTYKYVQIRTNTYKYVQIRTYKYVLLVIDIASRYKDAVPLPFKNSEGVGEAFKIFYSRTNLNWPETLMVDPGKEFMGSVTHLMKKHNVNIQRSETGHHRAQAFVERVNRTLGEKIFSYQYAQEMIQEGQSREWVKYYQN